LTLSISVEQDGSSCERPSIIVVDRRPLSRSCLARILRSELPEFAVIEVETSNQLDAAVGKNIGLIALNTEGFSLTDESVLQNLAHLHRILADGPLMVLTQLNESMITNGMISEVARFGVRGYITESTPVEIALAAVRLVIAGGAYFPRSIVIENNHSPAWTSLSSCNVAALTSVAAVNGVATDLAKASGKASITFTERERQVLAALQRGLSNKVIAGELNLSQNTVKVHISRIMHKLHAKNRTEAVILCRYSWAADERGLQDTVSSA
jgi:DNA-binding NarL/FixJ family response regulator